MAHLESATLTSARLPVLVLVGVVLLAVGKTEPRLLLWGENWKDNAPVRSGESWLALRNDGEKSSLERVTVLVSPQKPNGYRDVVVTLKEGFRPCFLVQGVAGLSPGKVRTVFNGVMPLIPHAVVHFTASRSLSEHNVYLQAIPSKDVYERRTKKSYKTYAVILHSYGDSLSPEQVTQTLAVYMENPGQTPSLCWAGDLDRDGRLDFLMDVETEETAGATYHLYLSSRAKRGELVGLAVSLRDPAC